MRIGIVGGGQLGRMLALAAWPLGHTCTVLDHSADAPAGSVARLIVGEFDDTDALAELAGLSDIVTFDFENVPADSAEWLAGHVRVAPSATALRCSQDRMAEKKLFGELGIPTPTFAAVDDAATLETALARVGLPAILKTRRLGYDGKGQRLVRNESDAATALRELGTDLVAEAFVEFEREVSIIAARGGDGKIACYPLVENSHRDGILRTTVAPALDSGGTDTAIRYVTHLLEALDYTGVIALELFECADGLLANEFAPRVHNSGHWTIEGAVTSQFENHLRAITGAPLGVTAARGHAAMVNFIGTMPHPAEVLAIPGAHFHDYGKSVRPGRKLGHATVVADSAAGLAPLLESLESVAARA